METPVTRFAKSADASIAYQVAGEGPVDLLVVPGVGHHVELNWEDPHRARWYRRVTTFARLILFDKRGTGMSDRLTGSETLEERMEDITAVLDAAGSDAALLLAVGDGTLLAALFAATHPERAVGLVLCHGLPRLTRAPDLPWLPPRADLERRFASVVASLGDRSAHADEIGRQNPSLAMQSDREAFARPLRLSVSPGALEAYGRTTLEADVRDILAAIRVPALVLCRTGVAIYDVRTSRYLADAIPSARLVELPGVDFAPIVGDWEAVAQELESFAATCLSVRRDEDVDDRVLATILVTDIVASTEHAARLGDRLWRDLLSGHHEAVRRELTRFRGKEVDTAGDGFLATFDGPARAVRCACAIVESVRELGVDVRAGVHTGECEVVDGKIGGIAVHIGARVAGRAAAGEVLVSSTVKDLVAGSGIAFDDRGAAELKGVPGEWRLYAAEL